MVNPPIVWTGGKRRAAALTWQLFGPDIDVYAEPFAGMAAVALARPATVRRIVLNDADGMVVNFHRSVRLHPDEVAEMLWSLMPSELEMMAWDARAKAEASSLVEKLVADPDACDPRLAAGWAYGVAVSITGSFTSGQAQFDARSPAVFHGRTLTRDAWMDWMREVSDQLRVARVLCGDWRRAITPDVLFNGVSSKGRVAVFFDPPYMFDAAQVHYGAYLTDEDHDDLTAASLDLSDQGVRVVMAGHEDERRMDPLREAGWRTYRWRPGGGRGRRAHLEVLLASPTCDTQPTLF